MKRIPSGLALLLLILLAAGGVGLSIFAGPTPAGDLTREIVLQYRLPRGILAFLVGASLGGFVIGLILSFSESYTTWGLQWADVIVFSILILVLVLRPTGLLGMRVPEK